MGVCLGSIVTQLLIMLPVSLVLIRNLFRRLENTKTEASPGEAILLA
jgi:hypothetical protein